MKKVYSNYPQYCKNYPQYFNCKNSQYDEEYYNNIQSNWQSFIIKDSSFVQGHLPDIEVTRFVSVTDYIEIKGNLKVTTYNTNINSAFTICFYDKDKNFIMGLPVSGYEPLTVLVERNISYKQGFYMRFRSRTVAFTNPTENIYVKIEKGD